MSVAIDTNIIVYILSGAKPIASSALRAVNEASARGMSLVIAAPVYAELLALPDWTQRDLDVFVAETGIRVEWNLRTECWISAGLAFASYSRRRKREKMAAARRLLADFIIGAHAIGVGRLLTADTGFYRTNFPQLELQSFTV